MSLTSRGRDLVDHAVGAVALMTAIRREIGQQDRVTGLLRLGATDVIALTWLPDLVARIRRAYPSLSVELLIDLTVNLRARLDRGELDVAILFGPVDTDRLVPRPMGLVDVGWMASPRLGLPTGVLTPADLARHPVLSHTKGTDHYHMMRKWFINSGVNLPLFNGCSSLSTLIQLTLSGIGSSILPLGLMQDEITAGRLRAIDTDPPIPPNLFEAVYPLDSLQPLDVEIVAVAAECAAAHPAFTPVPGAHAEGGAKMGISRRSGPATGGFTG